MSWPVDVELVPLTLGAAAFVVVAICMLLASQDSDENIEDKWRYFFKNRAFTAYEAARHVSGVRVFRAHAILDKLVEAKKIEHLPPDNRMYFLDRYRFLT